MSWRPCRKARTNRAARRARPSMGLQSCLRLEWLESRLTPSAGNILATYDQLPLSFEPNQGQVAAGVQYFSPGVGYNLFLEAQQSVLQLQNGQGQAPTDITTQLVGGAPNAAVTALSPQTGVSNYLIGADPSQWHIDVPHYAQVEYQNVYAHTNLVYYGNSGQLEYDFVVNPGGNPGYIRLAITGAQGLTLDAQGDLVLQTATGTVLERAPVVYQEIDGIRHDVAGRFVLQNNHSIGFAVGAYDATLPLVIDPTLTYSTYLGSSGYDQGNAIALDSSGDAYIAGSTTSTIDTGSLIQSGNAGGTDGFVVKLDSAGTGLGYYTYIGGSGYDSCTGIAVNSSGDAWVTGVTTSTNFPTKSPFQSSNAGSSNAFVACINSGGTALLSSSYLGGSGSDEGLAIALDSSGDAYITGTTSSTNFPTKVPLQSTNGGGNDAFVTEVSSAGTSLVYSSHLGGSGYDAGNAIALDSSGNIYVAGTTGSTNFPVKNAIQTKSGGGTDAFVVKINKGEGSIAYATYLGGSNNDGASGIAADSSGNAYVTGFTSSTNFPTLSAYQTTNKGGMDAFVTKINSTGSALTYSTYLGGSGDDPALAIAVNSSGDVYVAGSTSSTNFPTLSAVQSSNAAASGEENGYVTELNSTGSALLFSTYLGGNGASGDFADGIVIDSSGNAYVTGFASSNNFPTADAFQSTNGGGLADAFIAKIN